MPNMENAATEIVKNQKKSVKNRSTKGFNTLILFPKADYCIFPSLFLSS